MKKSLIWATGMWLGTLTLVANAAPVYLECETFNKVSNKSTNYKLTLDEGAQTVVLTDDGYTSGQSYLRPAQFAQADVKFNWVIPVLRFSFQYRVDRTNMEFSQTFNGDPTKTDFGTCKIAQPVKRQF